MNKQISGARAEHKFRVLLNKYGIPCRITHRNYPYDFIVHGKRIELKTSKAKRHRNNLVWFFNIHRHGKIDESEVDFYILRLENVPFSKAAIHLIIKAPVKRPTIYVSFRSLLQRHSPAAVNFHRFINGDTDIE